MISFKQFILESKYPHKEWHEAILRRYWHHSQGMREPKSAFRNPKYHEHWAYFYNELLHDKKVFKNFIKDWEEAGMKPKDLIEATHFCEKLKDLD